jgi:hypothetical protein
MNDRTPEYDAPLAPPECHIETYRQTCALRLRFESYCQSERTPSIPAIILQSQLDVAKVGHRAFRADMAWHGHAA